MKKITFVVSLLLVAIGAVAAEISFLENPVWNTVLERAKKENKMIFLDGYATWCGPCKNMDAETYKDQAVADFYNANFINVKYDMEKGEGKMLSEKYFVTAYPYLAFINTDGVMLHKGVGFMGAEDFVALGKEAKNPASQYYTLKNKALALSPKDFAKFAMMASGFEDEDFEQIASDYLAKQPDILGNEALIELVMESIGGLPNEKALDYFAKSKAKIISSGKYSEEDFEARLVGFTIEYSISDEVQVDPNVLDYDGMKAAFDKYIPKQAFFVFNYFRSQQALEEKKIDEAITYLELLIANTPSKVNYDQLCNAMMGIGEQLSKEGKLEGVLTKFEAIVLGPDLADRVYMKEFVKAVIYLESKELDKFKAIADQLISSSTTPSSVKEDLKGALAEIKK